MLKTGPSRGRAKRGLVGFLSLLFAFSLSAQPQPDDAIELSPLVKRLLDDDLLSDEQRREAMIFHGQWDELKDLSKPDELALAVAKYQFTNDDEKSAIALAAAFVDRAVSPRTLMLISRASYLAGNPNDAVRVTRDRDIMGEYASRRALLAQAYEDLGDYPKAIEQLAPIRAKAQEGLETFETAEDLTAAAQAVVMLARLEGRPAADFHLANKLLSKARDEVDPLYWPAYVAEAELLMAKGNPRQAMDAVMQALSLNPKSSEAWYQFGTMRTRFFDFDSANKAVEQLRHINEAHPLADALAVEIALRQKDVATAKELITPALQRYPTHRKLLSLHAAVQALAYDDDAKNALLEQFAQLAPQNPLAEYAVGQTLSDARQYALAEPHLKNAIRMMPGWSAPQLALGELYMQWGKLDQAAAQLQAASSLDPFHKQITNQLKLANEMLGYATITTDQFVVRYLPGIDEVLARDVALHMGEMVEVFIERFEHDPPTLTQVDLMPDDQHFAVRVTGMPDIWTIAACTGDVIAMTPPRPGPKRAYGAYNWLNVMGHEYAHVVNLSQTNNRVPHWFTEGCAVNMETTGRLWSQYQLLAECYNNDKLFKYDELNWGFIRPTEPYHRSLAYAQSAWIKEYIEEQFGWDKAIAMLDSYRRGVGEHETIAAVFGVEVDAFMEGFYQWAGEQVEAWGMSSFGRTSDDPLVERLLKLQQVTPEEMASLSQAFENHPDEPGLIKLMVQPLLAGGDTEGAIELIKLYQEKRPVDPWADRELARLALKQGEAGTALDALITLDRLEGDAPEYAVELSRVYRGRKDYERALHYAERALLREPYNATYRETAATIAVQHQDLKRAAFHVESLALLEPDRAIHPKRLAAIYKRLGRAEEAAAAQQRAESLESNN